MTAGILRLLVVLPLAFFSASCLLAQQPAHPTTEVVTVPPPPSAKSLAPSTPFLSPGAEPDFDPELDIDTEGVLAPPRIAMPSTSSFTAESDLDAESPDMLFAALPDAPGWTLPPPPPPLPPCTTPANPTQASIAASQAAFITSGKVIANPNRRCIEVNPYQRFLNATNPIPLSPRQKGYLAIRNVVDPANLVTIFGTAAFTVGIDAHTAYGPGFKGFARNTGYSFSQDVTGEFFGTFLIPSLFHEDPHYHREPYASVPHRIFHAIARTAIAQHDDGSIMPNYATLLTYPISAEISNLYVPGIHGNAASTAERILTGLATDPVNNIITEFLPDVARRVNIRVVFVQRVLNMVTAGASTGGGGAAN